jgi:hypothetical protein
LIRGLLLSSIIQQSYASGELGEILDQALAKGLAPPAGATTLVIYSGTDPSSGVENHLLANDYVAGSNGTAYDIDNTAAAKFLDNPTVTVFQERYGTEAACEAAVLAARWPHGFVCPHCEGIVCSRFERHDHTYLQRAGCRHPYSLLAGTVFDNTKFPLTHCVHALYVLNQTKNNVSALELIRHLGVCYRTALRMKHKLMQAMTHRDAARQLNGFVQMDDAYLGGERNGGKRGRGSENKRSFVVSLATEAAGHPQMAIAELVEGITKAAPTQWMTRPCIRTLRCSAMAWAPSAPRASLTTRIRSWKRTTRAMDAMRRAPGGSISSWVTSNDPWMKPIMRFLLQIRSALPGRGFVALRAGRDAMPRMVRTQAAQSPTLCQLKVGANQV